MTDVLVVPTGELSHPVILLILMKSSNRLLHQNLAVVAKGVKLACVVRIAPNIHLDVHK
ncbi:hypothetical protein CA85_51080 [Allorhodopirellula solitaria]|uniref:Uncharacterized protein n=1 Tax=Allorhodopirellula solitaria TaxID=2527987 RepID=A0A5C5WPZ9_9BACT|nr:hypothetical protein CA85_51080 [Allorhodopirellula solitaria]